MKLKSRIGIGKLSILFTDIYFVFTLIVCLVLVVFKFQDMLLPYFSDELWVYGPSVRKMGIYGPSMFPNSLALEDHWGHPLMFFFLGGIWCLIFGVSIFSTHLFASTLSVILLISIYIIGRNLFNKEVGFYTVLIFATQSIFHGQFSLVLPEVMLTIFTLLTIYFHYKKKQVPYLLFGICLVLTKESGVFPIAAIIIWSFIKDFLYKEEKFYLKQTIKKYIILSLPLLVLGFHFVLLKIIYGWFLMPIRVEAFEFNWEIYHERIMHTMHYVFIGQGRRPIIIVLFISAILFNRKYPVWVRLLVIVTAFSMMKIFFKYWILPDLLSMIVIPILLISLLKLFFWDIYKTNNKHGNIISIFSIFIVIYILFSSAQFDSLRYLLCVIPIYIMIGLYFVQKISYVKKVILPLVTVVSICFSFYYMSSDSNFGDDTNNYSDVCKSRIEAIKFLEEDDNYSRTIKAPFLFRHAIERPLAGYLESNKVFTNVVPIDNRMHNCSSCFYVFESIDLSEHYKSIAQSSIFELIHRTENNSIWIEIYSKKHAL